MGKPLDADSLTSESFAQDGRLRLAFLFERVLPVGELRDLARRHGLSINGFRIERAPAAKLGPLLADAATDVRREACEALLARLGQAAGDRSSGNGSSGADESASPSASDSVSAAVHRLVEQERDSAVADSAKQAAQLARAREQSDELRKQLARANEEAARHRARIGGLESELEDLRRSDAEPRADADHSSKIHELERDLEALGESEAGLRRLLALRETRLRDAEEAIRELEELVPKRRRRRRTPVADADESRERFRVPYFAEAFYRSLAGKDRGSVERALRSVFLLCTEGPSYPGLETKQIEGQELWSIRASLKLRVYFRVRSDGDVDVLALADREDQHTMLRRLKDR